MVCCIEIYGFKESELGEGLSLVGTIKNALKGSTNDYRSVKYLIIPSVAISDYDPVPVVRIVSTSDSNDWSDVAEVLRNLNLDVQHQELAHFLPKP